jgi:hypothetical protein
LQTDVDAQLKEIKDLCVANGSKDAEIAALKGKLSSVLQDTDVQVLVDQIREMKNMIKKLRCNPQDPEPEWWCRIMPKEQQAEDDQSAVLINRVTPRACGVGYFICVCVCAFTLCVCACLCEWSNFCMCEHMNASVCVCAC